MFLRCLGFASVVVCLGLSADLGAQKGGKPKPVDTNAMTTFRCVTGEGAGSPSCQAPSETTDRIRDDGFAYGYTPALGMIASSGFYSLTLPTISGRTLSLDLGDPSGEVPCVGAGNCNPDRVLIVNSHVDLAPASIELKPLVAAPGFPELTGLLWGMNCTDVYPAKVHYTFTLSGNGHWGFNFNHAVYPGSDNAVIRRTGNLQWTVESIGKGELLSWGHSGLLRRNSGPSHEGFFYANFKFIIEVVSLPSPSAGCS